MLVASGGVLVHRRVGYEVGNVRNDTPELIKAVPEDDESPNAEG
jgi:hypothetical protein